MDYSWIYHINETLQWLALIFLAWQSSSIIKNLNKLCQIYEEDLSDRIARETIPDPRTL